MKTKNFKFKSMVLVLFALVLSSNVWGADTWTQVTSVAVGDEVVIAVVDDGTQELTSISTTSTKYGIGTDFTTNPAGTMTWKVEEGSSTGTFAFKNGTNYLRWNSGNSVDAAGTAVESKTSWTITTSNSRAKVANVNTSSRILMWNKSSTRFACYENKNHGNNSGSYYYYVIFYKKAASKTLSSIAVTTQPTKKSYTTCETLDLSGCVVTATYSDAPTEDVTSSCTFDPADGAALTTSVTSVAVSYEGKAATISDISVTEGASDTYVDNVHGLTPSGDFSCSYKAPSLKDRTKGETSFCEDTHYHFVGWVEDGVDPQTNPVISAGTDMTGSNKTYKAVWAAEQQ